jgi:hypothetical protein
LTVNEAENTGDKVPKGNRLNITVVIWSFVYYNIDRGWPRDTKGYRWKLIWRYV